MRFYRGTLAACVAVTACADVSPMAVQSTASSPSASLVPLDRFGIGQGGRGNACRAPEYRQFDFWVGKWRIQTPQGAPAQWSVISSVLGGCALLENFFSGAGRSLNAYDDATGTWSQMYVGPGGNVSLLRGGFRSDSMILQERRSPVINDVWTWTKLDDGSVKQHQQLFINDVVSGGFVGIYLPAETVPSSPEPPVTACARAGSRQMDFLLGTWDVYDGDGPGQGTPQGRLVATTSTGGCLVEESLTGKTGFEALSYASFRPFAQRWLRTYMDSDGRYLVLNGVFDGTRMIMTGNRIFANGALVVVRVTWEPIGSDRVVQRWEFSLDAGATFRAEKTYTFVRR